MTPQFRSELLSQRHDASAFDCGVQALNQWLQQDAMRAQRAGSARTFVWTRPGSASSAEVLAYYSIAPTVVAKDSVSRSLSGGYTSVPAWLIRKLALHHSLQRRGLGAQLLLDALEVIVTVADRGGGRLIVVDASNGEAEAFYRMHDFLPTRGRRLVIKVATARAALHRD